MLRTHQYVVEQLTKKTMELLSHPNEVRFFVINGCDHYMCWIDEKRIAFGSGKIEVIIYNHMDAEEVKTLFTSYFNSYSEYIEYYFLKDIRTMKKLKEENPWFDMWKSE